MEYGCSTCAELQFGVKPDDGDFQAKCYQCPENAICPGKGWNLWPLEIVKIEG